MPKRMNNCCGCIPLRFGVIIISIISFIYGTCMAVKFGFNFISLNQGTNAQQYNREYTMVIVAIYISMAIGAAFGIFVVFCTNTSRMLSLYSKLAFLFAGVDILSVITGVIIMAVNRDNFLNACAASPEGSSANSDVCSQGYNLALTLTVATSVVSILLAVYFAMVIKAYSNEVKERENDKENAEHNQNDLP